MRRILARVHQGLAWAFLAGLLVQVYFAGTGLFGAQSLAVHEIWGYLLWLITPLVLVLALVGGLGRRLVLLSVALVLLTTLQVNLPHLRSALPWVAALHPLNAFVMIGVTLHMALRPSALVRPVGSTHQTNRVTSS